MSKSIVHNHIVGPEPTTNRPSRSWTKLYKSIAIGCVALMVGLVAIAGGITLFGQGAHVRTSINANNGTISTYNNYYFYQVANGKPLLRNESSTGGLGDGFNVDVGDEIDTIIKNITATQTPTSYGGTRYFERGADKMSNWVIDWANNNLTGTQRPSANTNPGTKSGGVFVKLFDSTGLTGTEKVIADQWFQVVYTSATTANAEPIITFYMADKYKTHAFHTSSPYPGYSASNIRTNTSSGIQADYNLLKNKFPLLDANTVSSSSSLPGAWQSQTFQSGTNSAGTAGSTGQAGYNYETEAYTTQNGMNATGTTPSNGIYIADKMWLPSAFEVQYMGHNKDTSQKVGWLTSYGSASSTLTNGYGRTGLWRLNGYDRVFTGTSGSSDQSAWFRSGGTGSTQAAIGVYYDGDCSLSTVTNVRAVRTALHLRINAFTSRTKMVTFSANKPANASNAVTGGQTTLSDDSGWEIPTSIDVPSLVGWDFTGYWTAASGGTQRYDGTGNLVAATTISADTTFYAQWTPKTNSIAFAENGTGVTDLQTAISHTSGNPIQQNVDVPKQQGYSFTGYWTSASGGSQYYNSSGARVSSANICLNNTLTLYAQWEPLPYYEIIYNMNGFGTQPETPTQHVYGTATPLEDVVPLDIPQDKSFSGWSLSNGGEIVNEIPAETVNPQLWANWDAVTYTVTFNANNGIMSNETAEETATIIHGNNVSAPLVDPTRKGYMFSGWYDAQEEGELFNFETQVTSDFTLWAHWTAKQYTAIYNFNGGTHALTQGTITFGEPLNLAVPRLELHSFDGWFSMDGKKQYTNHLGKSTQVWNDDIEEPLELLAHWTKTGFRISFETNSSEDSISPITVTQFSNMVSERPRTPVRKGHIFGGWFTDPELTSEFDFSTESPPTTDITLYAGWAVKTYTVVYNFNGGSHETTTGTVTWGQTYSLAVPKLDFFHFMGWFNAEGKPLTSTTGKSDDFVWDVDVNNYNVYARWEKYQYEMRFDFDDGRPWQTITHPYDELIPANMIPSTPTREFGIFEGWFAPDGTEFDFEIMPMPANGISLTARWSVNIAKLEKLVTELNGYLDFDSFESNPFNRFVNALNDAAAVVNSPTSIEGVKNAHDELLEAAVALTIADFTGKVTPPEEFNLPNSNIWVFFVLGAIAFIIAAALIILFIIKKRKENT